MCKCKLKSIFNHFAGAQAVWISDGCHSMHMIIGYDTDAAKDESNAKECEKNHIEISGCYLYLILSPLNQS